MSKVPNQLHTPEATLERIASSIRDRVVPVQEPMATVEVTIRSAPGLQALAEELHRYMSVYGPEAKIPSVDELVFAFETLVYLRVAQVRGLKVKAFRYDEVRYPVFLLPILSSIGDIEDEELGIRVRVILPSELNDVGVLEQRAKETLRVLDALYVVGKHPYLGLEFAFAFPRSHRGNVDLFMFVVVDDLLKSDTRTRDPIAAAVRSVLELGTFESIITRAQWSYGTVSDLRRLLQTTVLLTLRGVRW